MITLYFYHKDKIVPGSDNSPSAVFCLEYSGLNMLDALVAVPETEEILLSQIKILTARFKKSEDILE